MSTDTANLLAPVRRVLSESPISKWWGWCLAAWFAALSMAGLILLAGVIAKLLEDGGLVATTVGLGRNLVVPVPEALLVLDATQQLIWLVGIGLGLALLQAFALWWFYRGIHDRVRIVSKQLHEQVLATTLQVASSEGITAQRNRTGTIIETELPRLRSGLIARWRAVPRSVVLTVVCTILALMVDVWLTLLAVISGLIVWQLYRAIDNAGRKRTEAFDLPLMRKRLVEAVQVAPLVSRVRGDEAPVLESGGPLMRLLEAGGVHESGRWRPIPVLSAASAVVIALLVLAIGGNMLMEQPSITLPAALVLSLSLFAAVTGATRTLRYWGRFGEFREACENIVSYIERAGNGVAQERMGLGGKQHSIELGDVSLLDASGRVLLDGISLRLEPASVVSFLGTDAAAVNSLAELLLGFGNPRTGKLTIGDVPLSQLHEKWMSRNVTWIGRNGPIWAGTVTENLSPGQAVETSVITEATKKTGVYDRLQSLPEGFATLIAADDGRLDESTRYGLAIARTWIRSPAVVVVEEPPLAAGILADDPCMDTLCEMARAGALIIVLPQRLRTLRVSDRVILMNGGSLAGEGKHEELLATSDLYRHLNYVLFNPFRHLASGGRQY